MHLSIVVKASKLCNLRCAYCYETPHLDDPASMSLDDIRVMLRTVRSLLQYARRQARHVTFYWQGGEPFTQRPRYWKSIAAEAREIFAPTGAVVRNEIQSNGTLITEEHLTLFEEDFALGLSFDVRNDVRVHGDGRATDRKVVATLDWLLARGVPLTGCIAVVSRHNIDHPLEVADFFLSRGLDFRLLNIYTALDALPQLRQHAVDWPPYLRFCESILAHGAARQAMAEGLSIEPLTTALQMLRDHDAGAHDADSIDGDREWVLVVDTNGDLYSSGDLYDSRFCYGNIFRDPLPALLASDGRRRRVARGRSRVDSICRRCFLHGRGCDGAYVANCTPEEARAFESLGTCYYGWLAAAAARTARDPDDGRCTSA